MNASCLMRRPGALAPGGVWGPQLRSARAPRAMGLPSARPAAAVRGQPGAGAMLPPPAQHGLLAPCARQLAPPSAAFGGGRRRGQDGGLGELDPVKALQKELGVQSNKLDPKVKDLVERAIESLGYRVTVGDVAARAGVSIAQADDALKALAYDSLGALEVSKEGEVVYVFSRTFKQAIASRSWLRRISPLWTKTKSTAQWLTRVAFGTALVASVAVVWLAVLALLSSRDDNRRDHRGMGFGGGYGGGYNVWISPADFFWYWSPGYNSQMRDRLDSGERMNFVEAVFSFVFGDGDPNQSWQERRFRALGAHIQKLGGVVTAEEMAPFLDPPRLGSRVPAGPSKYGDESFVLPALLRFGGEAIVGEDGGLLYKFPALQTGATELRATATTVRVPLEREYEFSEAEPGQQAGALALGVFNVVGVLVLSSLLADPYAKYALFRQGLGFVFGLLPYLQAYAAAFFAIPFFRAFTNGRKNVEIAERNENRMQAIELLQSGDRDLAAKEAEARKRGERRVIGRQDIVYTTEQETDPQANRMEEEEFDSRLGVKGPSSSQRRGELPDRGRSAGQRRFDDIFDRRQGQREKQAERSSGRRDDWDRLDRW